MTEWSFLKLFFAVAPDCTDTACYLQIAMASIGVPVGMATHTPVSLPPASGIHSNRLCAIGGDRFSFPSYAEWNWNFHRTAYLAGYVWDSCAAHWYGTDGSLAQAPPAAWIVAPWWQSPPGSLSPMYGLVRTYGTPNPDPPPQTVPRKTTGFAFSGVY